MLKTLFIFVETYNLQIFLTCAFLNAIYLVLLRVFKQHFCNITEVFAVTLMQFI